MNWRAGERSFKLNIPVTGATKGTGNGEPFTHVQVLLSYQDGRGYFYAWIQAIRIEGLCESFLIAGRDGTQKTIKLDSGHKRYNAKQLLAWRQVLEQFIAARRGCYWDEIAAVVAAMGAEVGEAALVAA